MIKPKEGNSIIADMATGEYSNAQEAVERLVRIDRNVESPANDVYEKRYQHFLGLYEDLKDRFAANSKD